jgi:hypothetical protein
LVDDAHMTGFRSRPGRRNATWLLIVIFLLSLPAVTPRINASDEIEFFSWLHSWTFDRDVDFDNEYRYFYEAGPGRHPGFVETFLEGTNEAGRRPNFAPIGSAILWLPFYAGGHIAAGLSGVPTDGLSHPYIAAVAYGSAVYGFLAVLLSAAIARRLLGRSGLTAAALVWVGTPLMFYMYVAPGFSHACSAFAVALFLWVWLRIRERWSVAGVVALALAAALMPMVREQDAFFVVGPAIDFLRWAWLRTRPGQPAPTQGWRRVVMLAGIGVVTSVAAYTPQLASYQALNGHPSPTSTVARKMTWTSPHFVDVLLSPQHGLFLWTPLALVAVAGLAWLAVRARRGTGPASTAGRPDAAPGPHPDLGWIAALMLLMGLLQVYVSGSVESWTVAGAFGQRRFVALTPLLTVGMAALLPPPGERRRRLLATLAVCLLLVWWNLGLMAQFGLHLMDRQRLSIGDNARVTFIDLPRMAPSILVRYFADRESFYGLPRE